MIGIVIAVLVAALVYALCLALGLPSIVAIIAAILVLLEAGERALEVAGLEDGPGAPGHGRLGSSA